MQHCWAVVPAAEKANSLIAIDAVVEVNFHTVT